MDEQTKKSTIRGIADFLKVLAAIITSTAVVGGAILWFMLPRITEWLAEVSTSAIEQYVSQSESNAQTLLQVTRQVEGLVSQLNAIRSGPEYTREPALIFEQLGNTITNGSPGSRVRFTWRFTKVHNCGVPTVNVFFRNGDDIVHRFDDLSIVNVNGEGVDYSADPDLVQTLTYSGIIPGDEDVQLGRARGWVTLRYEQCPWAPPSISPEVPFQIVPPPQ